MAVVRLELEVDEVRDLLTLVGRQERSSGLFRARRELVRGLARGELSEAEDAARRRRARASRRIPDPDGVPLVPQSMSRRSGWTSPTG